MRHLILTAAAAVVLIPGTAVAADAPAPELHGVVKTAVTTPCEAEDSVNCYVTHDQNTAGDRHGYYSIRVGDKRCTVYFSRKHNRTHGFCEKA